MTKFPKKLYPKKPHFGKKLARCIFYFYYKKISETLRNWSNPGTLKKRPRSTKKFLVKKCSSKNLNRLFDFLCKFWNFRQMFDFYYFKKAKSPKKLQILKIIEKPLRHFCCKNRKFLQKLHAAKFSEFRIKCVGFKAADGPDS